jgi:protoporphyrinogen oxidase
MKVAIIGGGIAGLTCCYFLRKAGIKAELYEKKINLGGRIKGYIEGGFYAPLGAFSLSGEYSNTLSLIEELNLNGRLTRMHQSSIVLHHSGNLTHLSASSILKSRTFSLSEKFDFYRFRRLLRRSLTSGLTNDLQYISFDEFARGNFSGGFVEKFLRPTIWAFLAADLKDVSAFQALHAFSGVADLYIMTGGLELLISTLKEKVEDNLWLGCEVESVRSSGEVKIRGGDYESFDVVVLAIPLHHANALIPLEGARDVRYTRRYVRVVQGKCKVSIDWTLVNGDWKDDGINAIFKWNGLYTVTGSEEHYELNRYFDSPKLLHEQYWDGCGPLLPLRPERPSMKTEYERIYLCGDHQGGGIEGAVSSAQSVGETIIQGESRIS